MCMADNAARLAALGSDGVDLNFGCPAKVVNRHGGGAVLLQDPEQIHRIVGAVRAAVPAGVAVSAKMRLGFEHDRRAEECAQAIEAGGASELVVHARTKADGYRPPAYWHRVADVRAAVRLPVVANGEVWNVLDARRCLAESGASSLMIGRGAVVDPGLGWAIRRELGGAAVAVPGWAELLPQMQGFWSLVCQRIEPRARAGRLKQWLNFLRRRFVQAQQAYDELRTVNDSAAVQAWLERRPSPVRPGRDQPLEALA
jgi:tRNA-dihydrouridine synthase C